MKNAGVAASAIIFAHEVPNPNTPELTLLLNQSIRGKYKVTDFVNAVSEAYYPGDCRNQPHVRVTIQRQCRIPDYAECILGNPFWRRLHAIGASIALVLNRHSPLSLKIA
jgi:hypothetical protein